MIITFTLPPQFSIDGTPGPRLPRLVFLHSSLKEESWRASTFSAKLETHQFHGRNSLGDQGAPPVEKRHSIPRNLVSPPRSSPGSWNAECFQKPRRNMNVPHQQFPRGPSRATRYRARGHVFALRTQESCAPSCLNFVRPDKTRPGERIKKKKKI